MTFPADAGGAHFPRITGGPYTTHVGTDVTVPCHHCLVQLKIARNAARLLGFAILIWTIPAPFVRIDIASSATDPGSRNLLIETAGDTVSAIVPTAEDSLPFRARMSSTTGSNTTGYR